MKKLNSKISLNISPRIKKMLYLVAGVLLIALAYVFVFTRVQLANKELQTKVTSLRTTQQQMEIMVADEADNKAAILSMENDISDMLVQFPGDVKEEDIIMYADSLEQVTDLSVYDISFTPRNLLYSPDDSEGNAKVDYEYYLYSTAATYTFTVSYEQLKAVLAAIQNHDDLKNVESVILSYDTDTGLLMGTLVMNSYSIDGGSREYEEPDTPEMSVGTNNIFNTIR